MMRKLVLTIYCMLVSAGMICAQEHKFAGEGTESSPFIIADMDDLALLADTVNNTKAPDSGEANVFEGKHFRLDGDIDMGGAQLTPIGNKFSSCFGGTFDGNGKTLSNFTIDTGDGGYAGLFGRVSESGTIKDLNITGASISTTGLCAAAVAADCAGNIENCTVRDINVRNSYQFTGGIAGRLTGKINGAYASGYVEGGENSVGGIAGQNYSVIANAACDAHVVTKASGYSCTAGGISGCCYLPEAVISNCSFGGTVECTNDGIFIGGITGNLYKGRIEKSFNTGICRTESSNSCAGGIAGRTDDGSIDNCYNSGMVYAPYASSTIGGIAGTVNDADSHTSITCCYNTGIVVSDTYIYDTAEEKRELFGTLSDNAAVSNVYFDRQMSGYGSETDQGKATSEMTSANGLEGFSADVWVFTEGMYPRIAGMEDTDMSVVSASPAFLKPGNNVSSVSKDFTLSEHSEWLVVNNGKPGKEGYGLRIEGNNALLYGSFATDTLLCTKNDAVRCLIIKTSYMPFEGDGTAESPYLIKTAEDLEAMAEATNMNGETYDGLYFAMQNDIDLESADFSGISSDEFNAKPFAGIFDGCGHSIHNMSMEKVVFDDEGNADIFSSYGFGGFFGQLAAKGVVKNLTIADNCSFTFLYLSGAIVGYNSGLVENCVNSAPIDAYSYSVGGIVGENLPEGRVVSCLNTGDIKASQWSAGGIAGTASGTICRCMNTGHVESVTRGYDQGATLGGITGSAYDAKISETANAGTVTGNIETAGIAGSVDGETTVEHSVNYGMICADEPESAGQIAGYIYSAAGFDGNAFDCQIQQTEAIGDGEAEEAAGMTAAEMMTPIDGFDTEIWNFGNGHYPYIKSFDNIPDAKGAAHAIIIFAEGDNAWDVSTDATLGAYEDMKWSLASGGSFLIDGSTLSPYSPGTDTLTATTGRYIKKITVKTDKTSGIKDNTAGKNIAYREYFTLTGIKVESISNSDFYIMKTTYDDGTYGIQKIYRRK